MSGAPGEGGDSTSADTPTYETAQEYIDSLNVDGQWVTYDAASNTATVSGLAGFVASQKNATKDVGAFDGISRNQTENVVLGLGTQALHFSESSRDVIAANESEYATFSDWSNEFAADQYTSDFATIEGTGTDVLTRQDMINPMYYLSATEDGFATSTVAPNWRIRTGIQQGDTASTVEINLALALEQAGVESVDFATVWGQGHTMAERVGDGTTNFIEWVDQIITG